MRGFIAPLVLEGPIDRDAFETYVVKAPVPELRIGDNVVMVNFLSRKGPRAREIIEAARIELRRLAPCSPDITPIENAFGKLLALLRKVARRSIDNLQAVIGAITPPAECAKDFSAAGCDAT